MKQILTSFLLFALVTTATGQVKLEDVVKPGTKLIYEVTTEQSKYNFIVTVKDLKGTSFDWEMTRPADLKGTINHTAKALQNAFKMYNYFHSETRTLDDVTLSVWISQKFFKAFTKGDAVKICMNEPTAEPVDMKYIVDGDWLIKIDGDGTKIHDRIVKPARKVKDKWIVDPTNDDYFSYYNSASFPIIVRMHTSFTIVLKEIKTK